MKKIEKISLPSFQKVEQLKSLFEVAQNEYSRSARKAWMRSILVDFLCGVLLLTFAASVFYVMTEYSDSFSGRRWPLFFVCLIGVAIILFLLINLICNIIRNEEYDVDVKNHQIVNLISYCKQFLNGHQIELLSSIDSGWFEERKGKVVKFSFKNDAKTALLNIYPNDIFFREFKLDGKNEVERSRFSLWDTIEKEFQKETGCSECYMKKGKMIGWKNHKMRKFLLE
jgi:hypothetical protein